MTQIIIEGEVADEISKLARAEDRAVEEVLRELVSQYKQSAEYLTRHADDPDIIAENQAREQARREFVGMIDADVTDLSTTVKETLRQYFKDKDADSH